MVFTFNDIPDLSGKVAIVTGGNSGIGEISCKELAAKGARVYMASRSESKAKESIERIRKSHSEADVIFLECDLTDLGSVKSAVERFLSKEKRLDILLNNAGIMATPYQFTKDGLELQNGTNVMGHYLITMLLLPILYQTSKVNDGGNSVRIVQVSSDAIMMAPSDASFKDLESFNHQYLPEYKGTWTRYGKSKLGNVILSNEIKRMLPEGSRISNLSVHPGVINTGLTRGPLESYRFLPSFLFRLIGYFVKSPEQGALTQIFASTSSEIDEKSMDGAFLRPMARLGQKTKLAEDEEGRLGKELFTFARGFVKEKLGIDVAEYLEEKAGIKYLH
ncbi:NAD(P)-binding protein [Violaceomyces palustris]|uniref:NAD(P)-binding protein n=1 Tax=Violaceomyces palustris TaxID=1673888 RepID=A0ACD0NN36_9BASI|nr:NAD(P)-binding protein [Violaceomyces palustris]